MSGCLSCHYFVFQIDNKGNHLLVSEEASINVPAIAAAHVTKRYTAQATDELTFEVTSIVLEIRESCDQDLLSSSLSV